MSAAGDMRIRACCVLAIAGVVAFIRPAPSFAIPDMRSSTVSMAAETTSTPAFSGKRAMKHIKKLTANGPRRAGTSSERKAAEYVAEQLRSYGYTVTIQKVKIPHGRTSRNVIAEKPGATDRVIVLGAHLDSKSPAPGANDNASGVAVLLEEARILKDAELSPTVRFIAFGAEEVCGPSPRNHHYGSRKYVKSLSKAERKKIHGMISIDMVGYGKTFNIRMMKRGPMTLVKSLKAHAKTNGQKLVFLKDRGVDGWSDHEAFEKKKVPVAWLEWRYDPTCHKKTDTYKHVKRKRVKSTGKLVRSWVLSLTDEQVDALR